MRFLYLILLPALISFSSSYSQRFNDSQVIEVISNINIDSLRSGIQQLEDFGTRFMLYPNRFEISEWLHNRFISAGLQDVQIDTFVSRVTYPADTSTTQVNVIATIPGSVNPEKIFIIGAHYDSYSMGYKEFAPGADDDASGTSAIIEIARAIINTGIRPAATIKFIAFAAEELMYFGNSGAEVYAQKARVNNEEVQLMINLDMIANTSNKLNLSSVRIIPYSGAEQFSDLATAVTKQFTTLGTVPGTQNLGADSYAFYEQGFPAVFFIEDNFSPYYHTEYDKLQMYNMEYCLEVTKAAAALLFKVQNLLSSTGKQNNEPEGFMLIQNYPNPFNPETTITYKLPEQTYMSLKIYDVLGKEVENIISGIKEEGSHSYRWDASGFSAGIYICRLDAEGISANLKLVLMK